MSCVKPMRLPHPPSPHQQRFQRSLCRRLDNSQPLGKLSSIFGRRGCCFFQSIQLLVLTSPFRLNGGVEMLPCAFHTRRQGGAGRGSGGCWATHFSFQTQRGQKKWITCGFCQPTGLQKRCRTTTEPNERLLLFLGRAVYGT